MARSRKRGRWPSFPAYYYVIAGLLVVAVAIYVRHLITGIAPARVALRIDALNYDVFWYALWIVGGIALGSYVVSYLAQERAQAVFEATVPAELRRRPLGKLPDLPIEVRNKLSRRKVQTVGDLLLIGGHDASALGLTSEELELTRATLARLRGVNVSWFDDAPWRVWNPDHVWNGLVWVLILGIIGARIYHILTPSPSMAAVGIESPLDYLRSPLQMINIRSGGLGIYGALAGGALGIYIFTRRQRISALAWADLAVVGMALGQVFGRWGNFFNQELYGRPTDLPWALYIEPAHRLPAYSDFERFHPAFIYEALWNLLAFLVLHTLARRYTDRLRPGELMGLYLIFYAVGRSLLEFVRLDSRTITLGPVQSNLAVATLVSIVVALATAGWLAYRRFRAAS